ncbi:unnamed protein product [Rotaria socialis]
MLVLASYDRYCSSSHLYRLRSMSKIRKARFIIVTSTIIGIINMLPILAIYHWEETLDICLQYSNLLINIYISSQILLYYISAPILMIIFGLLAICNTRKSIVRTGSQSTNIRGRRTQKQLTQMLRLQMNIHLVLTVSFSVVYSMTALSPSTKTPNIIAVRYLLAVCRDVQCQCTDHRLAPTVCPMEYRPHRHCFTVYTIGVVGDQFFSIHTDTARP